MLIVANAFFVAAEFGLIAADRSRVNAEAEAGNASAVRVRRLLARLSYHLSGAQLGITVVSLVLGFVAEPSIAALIEGPVESLVGEGSSHGVSVALALTLATVLHMVLGELVPKNIAIAKPELVTRLLSRPVHGWGIVVRPLVTGLNGVANAIVRRLGIEPRDELDHARSLEELEQLIESAGEHGTLDRNEVELLTRSIRFGDKTVAEALTPRVEVEALAATDTLADLVELSVQTGFSRFPVYGDDLDDVVGLVEVRAVLACPVGERPATLVTSAMTEPIVVPESRELTELFGDLRRSGQHLAVVIDEHGGLAGIATLEDLIEEIVGEISDEHDAPVEPAELTRVEGRGAWLLPGSLHIDEVADACGLELPEGEYETLAGFVLSRLGRIPEPGALFDHDGWRIEVVAMDRLRVATVRVRAPR